MATQGRRPVVDEGLLALMREDLDDAALVERRMFGGVAFMLAGNMVCGVHGDHANFRVGKDRMEAAFALPDTGPFRVGARGPMGGMVQAGPEAMADPEVRGALLRLALENARSLPPK